MNSIASAFEFVVCSAPFWIPVALAYWLSDGFRNVVIGDDGEFGTVNADFNPVTEEPGWSVTHPGGNKTYL